MTDDDPEPLVRRMDVGHHADPAELDPPSVAGESVVASSTGPVLRDAGEDEPIEPGKSNILALEGLDQAPPVFGAGSEALGTPRGKIRIGDRIFRAASTAAGIFIILLVTLVGVFLVVKAVPALRDNHASFLFSRVWSTDTPILRFGIVDLLWATVVISLIAMLLALPISLGIALFLTQYAPKSVSKSVAYVVDLLAAIPSIVYGIWGIAVLAPKLAPVQRWFYHLDWIPFFRNENVATGTIFDAGIVLAIMILPIMTAISRDVFERTPRHNIEAAWALGATRWEMIRLAVLPYGRPGVISGAMLGLGRALGETVAMYLILSAPAQGSPFTPSIFNGGETFASKIANNAAEFETPKSAGAYIAAGLVLFVLTFLVNAAARAVVNRRKEFV